MTTLADDDGTRKTPQSKRWLPLFLFEQRENWILMKFPLFQETRSSRGLPLMPGRSRKEGEYRIMTDFFFFFFQDSTRKED
jgi:hypothetical protein